MAFEVEGSVSSVLKQGYRLRSQGLQLGPGGFRALGPHPWCCPAWSQGLGKINRSVLICCFSRCCKPVNTATLGFGDESFGTGMKMRISAWVGTRKSTKPGF